MLGCLAPAGRLLSQDNYDSGFRLDKVLRWGMNIYRYVGQRRV